MLKKQKPTEGSLQQKAADLLARRPHFSKELEAKLVERGFEEEKVREVIKDFEERGYLNDSDHALLYLEELKRKKYGRYEAVRRLSAKGVEYKTAQRITETFFLEKDERENIRYLLNKKKFNLKDIRGVKQASDFLMRRGFGSDLIREVLKFED